MARLLSIAADLAATAWFASFGDLDISFEHAADFYVAWDETRRLNVVKQIPSGQKWLSKAKWRKLTKHQP